MGSPRWQDQQRGAGRTQTVQYHELASTNRIEAKAGGCGLSASANYVVTNLDVDQPSPVRHANGPNLRAGKQLRTFDKLRRFHRRNFLTRNVRRLFVVHCAVEPRRDARSQISGGICRSVDTNQLWR